MCSLEGLSTKACKTPCALSVLSLEAQCLTVVVKAMCDLVPDDHSYAAVIQRFGLGGTEERGLQNARREDWKKSHSTVKTLPRYPAWAVGPDHFYGLQPKSRCSLWSPSSTKWLTHGNAVGQEEQSSRITPLFRHFQNHDQHLLCYYFALRKKQFVLIYITQHSQTSVSSLDKPHNIVRSGRVSPKKNKLFDHSITNQSQRQEFILLLKIQVTPTRINKNRPSWQ